MIRKIFSLASLFLLAALAALPGRAQSDSLPNPHIGQVIDQVIAVVGGEIVKESDIEYQFIQLRSQGADLPGDLKCVILEEQLFQYLLLDQAKIDSIEISEREVASELERRLEVFINRAGGQESLEAYFGKTLEEIRLDFQKIVRQQLLTDRMRGQLTAEVKISPNEVQRFYRRQPQDSLPLVSAKVELFQVVLYPKADQANRQLVIDKLMGIRERVVSGQSSFASLATLYSEDPGSAREGGDLGLVSRGDMVQEFSAAAFSLAPNQVSGIVETEFGFHLIQMVEMQGTKAKLRHILLKPRIDSEAKTRATQMLDSIRTLILSDSLTFSEAAAKFSDDEESKVNGGLMVNPYNGTSTFEIDQLDLEPGLALVVNDLEVGQISEPFQTTDMRGRPVVKIVMLASRTRPHVANLQDDYQMIMDMAQDEKEEQAINEWIKEKQRTTYIRVDESYQNCGFTMDGWIRK